MDASVILNLKDWRQRKKRSGSNSKIRLIHLNLALKVLCWIVKNGQYMKGEYKRLLKLWERQARQYLEELSG